MLPLLFPEFMQHSHIAQSVPAVVVSAGHVHLEDGKMKKRWTKLREWLATA